jgi:hypothetical protein
MGFFSGVVAVPPEQAEEHAETAQPPLQPWPRRRKRPPPWQLLLQLVLQCARAEQPWLAEQLLRQP